MSYRRFVDRAGNVWQVRDRSRSEWIFEPAGGNPESPKPVRAPSYQSDPFELSTEELQRLLDSASSAPRPRAPSPFDD